MRTRFQSQPLFFLFLFPFFSLFLLLTTSLRHQFYYFLSDVASSPLVYFKEMRFSLVFFDFEAHTHSKQKIKKSVFRLGRPEIGFRNFASSPSLPLSFIRLPPRTFGGTKNSLSYERMNERMNEPRTERTVKTTTSSSKRRRLCRSPSPHSLLRGDEEPKEKEGREESKKYRRQLKNVKKRRNCAWTSAGASTR